MFVEKNSLYTIWEVYDNDFIFLTAEDDESEVDSDEEHDDDEDLGDETANLLKVSVPLDRVAAGEFRLVYAHPEALLTAATGRRMLRENAYQENVCCIAIDEAHMIYEW